MSIFKNYGLDSINDFESLNTKTKLHSSFTHEGDLKVENSVSTSKVIIPKQSCSSTRNEDSAVNTLLRRK